MSKILLIFTILLTILVAGCANTSVISEEKIEHEETTIEPEFLYMEEVYAHAKNSFSTGDWEGSFAWYERLYNDYPDNPYKAESLFIRGYIKKTLYDDRESASEYFNELITKYPDSDFCNSAEFELEHINDPGFMPEFEKQENGK